VATRLPLSTQYRFATLDMAGLAFNTLLQDTLAIVGIWVPIGCGMAMESRERVLDIGVMLWNLRCRHPGTLHELEIGLEAKRTL